MQFRYKAFEVKPSKSVNRKIIVWRPNAEIKIQGFGKYSTKVIFSNQIPLNSFGVLGNRGFFNNYEVNFKYNQKIIVVDPTQKN